MYRNFSELVEGRRRRGAKKRVAVVAAEDEHALEAVFSALDLVTPILIGAKGTISSLIEGMGRSPKDFEIIDAGEGKDSAASAVRLIGAGEADFMMKGKIETADVLREVVREGSPLRTGSVISHLAFFELPNYKKLLVVTDGGMILSPDLEQKTAIVENAVATLRFLGYERPKVACLAAIERVNPKMPETVDAAALARRNSEGRLANCVVVGPISYDLAMSPASAKAKDYSNPHCGDFDVLLVPNIVCGNVLGKCLVFSAGATMAGIVVGASVPIVLTSRGSSAEEKYLSLVLSAAVCDRGFRPGHEGEL